VRAIESKLEPLQRLEAEALSTQKLLGRLDARILEQAFRGELTHLIHRMAGIRWRM
jgi:hypothetical protein